ncbi:MAG TPA: GH25 family lysozyme [Actinomycetota bacterium]|nr:GH25 family lysozyme [Actinomycetota bacterium]
MRDARRLVAVGGRRRAVIAVALVASVVLVAVVATVALAGPGGDGYAGWSGDADGRGPSVVAAQPAGAVPGIDVSHHQDTIDWAQVAASGKLFAIAKATEGRTFVDPLYAINKVNAQANGLRFGAYHFAQPDATPGDAIAEADHFVDTAQLTPGNLIPVLDIERTGGLSQAEVTQWILAWLGRVTEQLGVQPMVYTSPNGWNNRTGDTTAVVEAGYTVLWVAHWFVEQPTLPANDWGGHGWTFWQHSNCGTVPGISGCVDLDWYESADFGPVTIPGSPTPNPDVTPPVATLAPPAGVGDPMTVAFSEVVRNVTPTNTLIRSAGTGAAVGASLSCRSGPGAEVDCQTGNVRTVLVQPLEPLLPGESYEAAVNPLGTPVLVTDRSGNPAPETVQGFEPPTEIEQDSAAVSYAWRTASHRRALGRSYMVERSRGAEASFAFTGRSLTWYTATGPDQGKAAVRIDGASRGTFDLFGSTFTPGAARRFTGLERGPHTITIRALGKGSAKATDTQVVVDAFEARGDLVANPQLETSWGTVRASQASGGSVWASDLARASVTFAFRGTGVEWYTVRDRWQGRAEVYVDGQLVRTVDNFAKAPVFGVVRSVSGLTDGTHTLRIVVLGEGRRAADGTLVSIDRFVVLG